MSYKISYKNQLRTESKSVAENKNSFRVNAINKIFSSTVLGVFTLLTSEQRTLELFCFVQGFFPVCFAAFCCLLFP